jgi:uncharacterized protein YceH (UPF0502 family)
MQTHPELNAHEARLLGVLFEKERTTPDQYPLSLNALTLGANQKSNRDPATDWSEAEVFVGLTGLMQKALAGKVVPAGSRVEKFRHNARETLGLDDRKLALLAELLMRGPQTVAELRARAQRMSEQGTPESVLGALASLAQAGFVRRIEPGPGSRAERWVQLLSPDLHPLQLTDAASTAAPRAAPRAEPRLQPVLSSLEERVAKLEARIDALERSLGGQ